VLVFRRVRSAFPAPMSSVVEVIRRKARRTLFPRLRDGNEIRILVVPARVNPAGPRLRFGLLFLGETRTQFSL
jgi:hypothetical protein